MVFFTFQIDKVKTNGNMAKYQFIDVENHAQ
jgi:hypothetical protein